MKRINALILQLASLQAALLVNANAYDDDLEDTWSKLKDDYDALKVSMDAYLKSHEEKTL